MRINNYPMGSGDLKRALEKDAAGQISSPCAVIIGAAFGLLLRSCMNCTSQRSTWAK